MSIFVVEKFDGCVLVLGGFEGVLKFWDFEESVNLYDVYMYWFVVSVVRILFGERGCGYSYGIMYVVFYLFDLDVFLLSLYDKLLKLWLIEIV